LADCYNDDNDNGDDNDTNDNDHNWLLIEKNNKDTHNTHTLTHACTHNPRLRLPALLQMAKEVVSGPCWPWVVQEKGLRRKFKSPKARAALSFQSLYLGLTPFNAPQVFNLLQVRVLSFLFFNLLAHVSS
jgi:hypothetical protein